jgi:hypothetical protein
MFYIIAYLLFSFVVIGIVFYLIEHSPSGWEDENGFHIDPTPPHLNSLDDEPPSDDEIISETSLDQQPVHNDP